MPSSPSPRGRAASVAYAPSGGPRGVDRADFSRRVALISTETTDGRLTAWGAAARPRSRPACTSTLRRLELGRHCCATESPGRRVVRLATAGAVRAPSRWSWTQITWHGANPRWVAVGWEGVRLHDLGLCRDAGGWPGGNGGTARAGCSCHGNESAKGPLSGGQSRRLPSRRTIGVAVVEERGWRRCPASAIRPSRPR